jgi:5,5'-dehydrodivanillate O-demethylase oxygenase subunit
MLTVEENERLSRVGPGTPMGDLLRRYWHPIAPAEDVEREEVVPVRILGEDLVLFKSMSGDLGLIQQRCAHRSASLAYGVPDERGIRCPYHGWLYDGQGRCLEQPYDDCENPDNTFKDKIRLDAYPVKTLGGLVWAYMGPQPAPLLPRWDLVAREDLNRSIGITHLPCNWLQCMENSLDPVHFEWLHANVMNYTARRTGEAQVMNPARHRAIAFDRFQYGIYKRRLLEGDDPVTSPDWLTGHPILFPNTLDNGGTLQIRVPIDDTNTLHFLYRATERKPGEPASIEVYDYPCRHEDGRLLTETVIGTDMMAWITQGPLTPRHLERLGVSDRGIIMYRQMLNDAIDAVERGEEPPGLIHNPEDNLPYIEIKTEEIARDAYRVPGQPVRGTQVGAGVPRQPHARPSRLAPRQA